MAPTGFPMQVHQERAVHQEHQGKQVRLALLAQEALQELPELAVHLEQMELPEQVELQVQQERLVKQEPLVLPDPVQLLPLPITLIIESSQPLDQLL